MGEWHDLKDLEWSGCGLIEVQSRNLRGRNEQNHKSLRAVDVLAEIRTEHLPNESRALPLR
jgi:hypothetical protein